MPNGVCSGNGIGEMIRDFRIGTAQCMLCFSPNSPYMDRADVYPTPSIGQDLPAGQCVQLVGADVIASFRILSAGHVNAEYFK